MAPNNTDFRISNFRFEIGYFYNPIERYKTVILSDHFPAIKMTALPNSYLKVSLLKSKIQNLELLGEGVREQKNQSHHQTVNCQSFHERQT
jgi:hypothetical protein